MRTSPKEIRQMIKVLQNRGHDIDIEWGFGRPRCYKKDRATEIGPRLPCGEMKTFIDGIFAGLELAEETNHKTKGN